MTKVKSFLCQEGKNWGRSIAVLVMLARNGFARIDTVNVEFRRLCPIVGIG
jgi:hypothetical protein